MSTTPLIKEKSTTQKKPKPSKNVKKPIRLKQVLTVANIQNQKLKYVKFNGDWLDAFGKPQDRGVWFVWGGSGSGKSTFVMQLAKQFAKHYKTLYNLLEEETDDSDYIDRTILCQMNDVQDTFYTAGYSFEETMAYLDKRDPPKVMVIDSITYMMKDWNQYLQLKEKCRKLGIIIVIVGHAEGKNPRTEFEKSIMYDAKMKIFITGYLAICKGRTIGKNGGRFVVWQEGYEKLRGASE